MSKFIKILIKPNVGPEEIIIRKYATCEEDIWAEAKSENLSRFQRYLESFSNDHKRTNFDELIDAMWKYNTEQKSVLDLINDLSVKTLTAKLNFIDKGHDLIINKAGGYCDLKGFLKIWNGTVLDIFEYNNWPEPGETLDVKKIGLENAFDCKENYFYGDCENFICDLKNRDINYVFKSLENADEIYVSSQFLDEVQTEKICDLFLNFSGKYIHLHTFGDKKRLTSLEKYNLIKYKNVIKWYS